MSPLLHIGPCMITGDGCNQPDLELTDNTCNKSDMILTQGYETRKKTGLEQETTHSCNTLIW